MCSANTFAQRLKRIKETNRKSNLTKELKD